MKVMIISDIHGSHTCLEAVLPYYKEFGCEKLLILGDELYHGPRNPLPEGYDCKAVAATLNAYKDVIVAVRGNCDAEVDQMMLEYPCMDTMQLLDINGKKVLLTHGHIYNEDNLPDESFDILMSGHTHVPVLHKEGGHIFLNPGSITLPKNDTPKCFAIMDEEKIVIYTVENKEVYKELIL